MKNCPILKAALLQGGDCVRRIREGDAECGFEGCGQWSEERRECGLIQPTKIEVSGGINTHQY